ncbi:pyridoxamine 5'-phosphate oxidase family protein [Acuticoccus sp. M5D2P5]|uniref:pyridoxamine 5'-phosphate oxidase family protein n=1 Tax=Acuticoccus kalidii TaxID=2910977 RepID=UPI001F388424|nr:pyridoxamine 5'-phosphate oxidase family protein [Acuticoccus kalidii]MCF3933365.1 pyridoxamine 5'-phosphate oxidase family protein [Acuticoccus kalidii]
MVDFIATEDELLAHYGTPKAPATVKVSPVITPHYRAWIEASPFFALASVGPEGADCSPRGDAGPAVRILDERTIAIPDRRGNDRIDTLRNIVRDPRVALMFLIPGSGTVLRVNGEARITADEAMRADFAVDGKAPRTVVLVTVGAVYFQCARAVLRAKLWDGGHADPASLPSIGTMLEALSSKAVDGAIDGAAYDATWPGRAAGTMW